MLQPTCLSRHIKLKKKQKEPISPKKYLATACFIEG